MPEGTALPNNIEVMSTVSLGDAEQIRDMIALATMRSLGREAVSANLTRAVASPNTDILVARDADGDRITSLLTVGTVPMIDQEPVGVISDRMTGVGSQSRGEVEEGMLVAAHGYLAERGVYTVYQTAHPHGAGAVLLRRAGYEPAKDTAQYRVTDPTSHMYPDGKKGGYYSMKGTESLANWLSDAMAGQGIPVSQEGIAASIALVDPREGSDAQIFGVIQRGRVLEAAALTTFIHRPGGAEAWVSSFGELENARTVLGGVNRLCNKRKIPVVNALLPQDGGESSKAAYFASGFASLQPAQLFRYRLGKTATVAGA